MERASVDADGCRRLDSVKLSAPYRTRGGRRENRSRGAARGPGRCALSAWCCVIGWLGVWGDWPAGEGSFVPERSWVPRWQIAANDRHQFASLCNDVALFVEQLDCVKPGAEVSGLDHQHELPVCTRQPGAKRAVDERAHEFTARLGESGRDGRSDLGAAWSQRDYAAVFPRF
jgi:hypothetical protein